MGHVKIEFYLHFSCNYTKRFAMTESKLLKNMSEFQLYDNIPPSIIDYTKYQSNYELFEFWDKYKVDKLSQDALALLYASVKGQKDAVQFLIESPDTSLH